MATSLIIVLYAGSFLKRMWYNLFSIMRIGTDPVLLSAGSVLLYPNQNMLKSSQSVFIKSI